MTDKLTIALLQFDVAWLDVEKNLMKVKSMCSKLDQDVDIIFLPEMFATGFTVLPEQLKVNDQNIVLEELKGLSNTYQAAVSGSHPYFENGSYYNRLFFIKSGSLEGYYNKRHLFSIGNEHLKYKAGSERKLFEVKGWKLMPQICYDLRFPVWSRNTMGYDLLYYAANWPDVRNYTLDTLLKARAIENQCYVVGVNRIGVDGRDISYMGNSQVISAKGEIITKMEDIESLRVITLQKEVLHDFRRKFPVLNDLDSFRFE